MSNESKNAGAAGLLILGLFLAYFVAPFIRDVVFYRAVSQAGARVDQAMGELEAAVNPIRLKQCVDDALRAFHDCCDENSPDFCDVEFQSRKTVCYDTYRP
jgi:hypothetical protein